MKKELKQEQSDKLYLDNNAGPQQPMFPIISSSSNPLLSAIHILLKLAIVAAYLIIPLFVKSITFMQFIIVGSAIDFWIVKNISGRLLVGLRWWVDFDDNSEQIWRFQCKVNEKDINPANDKIFWWTLAFFSLVWIILVIINILRLDITQVTICIFCAVMLIFNLYSYYKCSKAQSQNIKKLAYQYGTDVAGKFMSGTIVANYF